MWRWFEINKTSNAGSALQGGMTVRTPITALELQFYLKWYEIVIFCYPWNLKPHLRKEAIAMTYRLDTFWINKVQKRQLQIDQLPWKGGGGIGLLPQKLGCGCVVLFLKPLFYLWIKSAISHLLYNPLWPEKVACKIIPSSNLECKHHTLFRDKYDQWIDRLLRPTGEEGRLSPPPPKKEHVLKLQTPLQPLGHIVINDLFVVTKTAEIRP